MWIFSLNRKLLPMKLHYGLYYAGASIQIIMPTYSKMFGFSSYIVGIIYTILPLITLFIKPAFGALADKMKWHKGVLMLWVLVTMLGFGCIWFIPVAQPTVENKEWRATWVVCGANPLNITSNFHDCSVSCAMSPELCRMDPALCQLYNNRSYQFASITDDCEELTVGSLSRTWLATAGCERHCNSSGAVDFSEEGGGTSDSATFANWHFWVFLVLLVLGSGGISVTSTITDTICVETCGDQYGRQRLWGSMAWGLASMIVGFIIDAVSGDDVNKNYLPAFIILVPPIVLDIIVCFNLQVSIPAKTESLARDALAILLVPKNILFALWCIMVGASFGLVWNFMFWLLEGLANDQGPDVVSRIKTIEGLIAAVETFIGETPAFFFGGWIVNKLGHEHSMSLVFSIMGLRFIIYSVLTNPWYFLPVEILQNNYGVFYSTMTSYAKRISTPGTEATIQTILCGLCEGIGVAIGSYLGGLFFDLYGGSTAFLIFGVAFVVLACINESIEFSKKIFNRHR